MTVGTQINLRVEMAQAQRALSKLKKTLNKREYLKLVGTQLLRWVNENFKAEGLEKKWAPLSPNTIIGRRKEGRGAKILQDTGGLRKSFIDKVSKQGQWVAVGTQDKKAQWHHFGTKPYIIKPRTKKMLRFPVTAVDGGKGFAFARQVNHPGLPARPLVPSESRGREIAVEELKNYIKVITKEANQGGKS